MSGIVPSRIADEGASLPDSVAVSVTYSGDDVDIDGTPGLGGASQWKQPVLAATTADVDLSTLADGDVVDGVTLAEGDRLLAKDQSDPIENGLYIVGAAAGDTARAGDMDDDTEVLGAVVYVVAGTANAGTAWKVTNTAATVVDTDAINWAAFGGSGGGVTVEDEGTPLATTATTLDFVGAGVTATGSGATKTITIPGGSGLVIEEVDGSPTNTATKLILPNGTLSYAGTEATYTPAASGGAWPPLDQYALDGTYGDHFTAASLSGSWTRRNFVSGNETYQVGKNQTYLRLACGARAAGDGYLQTAPGSDWTIAGAFIARNYANNVPGIGLTVLNSSGTGVACNLYSNPLAFILYSVTTYTTYSGSFVAVGGGSTMFNSTSDWNNRKMWMYLRKSGTNYYAAYSVDGEIWSPETAAFSWAGTVDRVGFGFGPLGNVQGASSAAVVDVDWFNKIA